jgi:hypothetical protein
MFLCIDLKTFHFRLIFSTFMSYDASLTELATFSILPCWAFFKDSYFSNLYSHQSALFVPCGGCKSRPVHLIRDVIFPILKDRSARYLWRTCGILVLSFGYCLAVWNKCFTFRFFWLPSKTFLFKRYIILKVGVWKFW